MSAKNPEKFVKDTIIRLDDNMVTPKRSHHCVKEFHTTFLNKIALKKLIPLSKSGKMFL